jgi:drug/metabolite transporter (DMT)-like permease
MNGILYEWFSRALPDLASDTLQQKFRKMLQKCFWACTGMGALGLILSVHASWAPIVQPKLVIALVGFAFVGGFLYWLCNLIAFQNLPTVEASVLAQGETPAVIIGAGLLLHEHLGLLQWVGVGIALCGAWYLSRWLQK